LNQKKNEEEEKKTNTITPREIKEKRERQLAPSIPSTTTCRILQSLKKTRYNVGGREEKAKEKIEKRKTPNPGKNKLLRLSILLLYQT